MLLLGLFAFFAALTVGSGLVVLATRQLLYAAFALLGALLGIAALYALAAAEFIAVAQLVVYVGGILVLLIFGIMLTHKAPDSLQMLLHERIVKPAEGPVSPARGLWLGVLLSLLLFAGLAYLIHLADFEHRPWIEEAVARPLPATYQTTPALGYQLMTYALLAFEVSALILLVALVGAAVIAAHPTKTDSQD
ncbi:NADH-quinone oxidoreductase subunit J family protein [Eisenibacter elegans]|jgi:NADH-quinone oxidoreductase subunit J|uniref:NADH-quinone oxidoreductase subunit J family protein n=1 Tax=Eisenibacter elegans TaxID=997 RepID=UPI0004112051|nr:NADH-quinone oxidoreductase subunit J [Eisenibacter elegans]